MGRYGTGNQPNVTEGSTQPQPTVTTVGWPWNSIVRGVCILGAWWVHGDDGLLVRSCIVDKKLYI